MYKVFDSFMHRPSWHTGHRLEVKAFNAALNQVVDNPDFDPDSMGIYLQSKVRTAAGDQFESEIEKLVTSAWAVKEFLQDTAR